MIDIKPLYEKLEFRPTVSRVIRSMYGGRSMNIEVSTLFKIGSEIFNLYVSIGGEPMTRKMEKCLSNDFYYTKVRVYPAEFIPVMKNIIKKHIEG